MTPALEQLERDVREMREMLKSRAWELVCQAIDDDILRAAMALGGDPRMPETEIHYRRGAIHAAANTRLVPEMLLRRLENEHLMAEAQKSIQPTNHLGE